MHHNKSIGQQMGNQIKTNLETKQNKFLKNATNKAGNFSKVGLEVMSSLIPIPGFGVSGIIAKGIRALIKPKVISKFVQKFGPKTTSDVLGPSGSYVKNKNFSLARDYNADTKEIKNVFVPNNKTSKIYRTEDINAGTVGSSSSGFDWFDEVKHTATKGYYNKNVKDAVNYGKRSPALVPPNHPRRTTSLNVTENYKNARRAGNFDKASDLSGGKGNRPLYNEIVSDPGLMSNIRKQGVIKNNPNKIAQTFIGPKAEVEKLYDNPLFLKTKK